MAILAVAGAMSSRSAHTWTTSASRVGKRTWSGFFGEYFERSPPRQLGHPVTIDPSIQANTPITLCAPSAMREYVENLSRSRASTTTRVLCAQ